MSNDRLLERIQKLLNLSASSNANEAASAMAKAQELMREYALTELDVKAHMIGEAQVKSTQSVSKPKDWECNLVIHASQAFGCSVLWQPGHSWMKPDYWGRYIIVGEKSKVPLAEYATVVLLRQLAKERTNFSKRLSQAGYRRGTGMTAELDGFCHGWINTVQTKISKFANEPEVQQLIDARLEKEAEGRHQENDSRGNGAMGHHAGIEAGRDVELNRPMNQEERRMIG